MAALCPKVMSRFTYAWAYGEILFPTWQRVVRRRPIGERLERLRQSQWHDAEVIARYQTHSLRALLAHSLRNVPYYKQLFENAGFDPRAVASTADLTRLPILTRAVVRERYDDLCDPAYRGRAIEKQTSGTSGVPLRFEYSQDSETWRQATRLRAYEWAGYRPGARTLHYWGTGTRVPRGLRAIKTRLDRSLRREVFVDCGRQDEQAMREFARALERLRPHALVAYTRALAIFARWAIEARARAWDDMSIIGGAEAMLPADRAAIAQVFGPRVYETYGARETMLIAAECDAHDGLHVAEENLVVEIVRDDGRPAAPGETGAVVVTDLHNWAMPLIRYANGDLATCSPPGTCRCGRSLRRLARVDGRQNDTMRDGRGAPVPGMLFISLLNTHEAELREFQAIQRRSGEVELHIVPGRAWSDAAFAETSRRLASYFPGLPFRVVLVDAIPSDPSGKRRAVVVEQ
jgi:phenylacetate-CoA ligase